MEEQRARIAKRRKVDNSMEEAALEPSQGKKVKEVKGQAKISSYGPNGENRHKFKRHNPQKELLNEIPHEVSMSIAALGHAFRQNSNFIYPPSHPRTCETSLFY